MPELKLLTTSATSGGTVITPGIGAYTYNQGESASIYALEDDGFHFTGWTGTASDAGKVTYTGDRHAAVLMDADYTVRAEFGADVHKILFDSSNKKLLTDSDHKLIMANDSICLMLEDMLPELITIELSGVQSCECIEDTGYITGVPGFIKAVSTPPNGIYNLHKYCEPYVFDGYPYYKGTFVKDLKIGRWDDSENCSGEDTEEVVSSNFVIYVITVPNTFGFFYQVIAGWEYDNGIDLFFATKYCKDIQEGTSCCWANITNFASGFWGEENNFFSFWGTCYASNSYTKWPRAWALFEYGSASVTICRDVNAPPCGPEPTTTTGTTTDTTTTDTTTTDTTTTDTTTTPTTSTSTTTTATTTELPASNDCCVDEQWPFYEVTLSGVGLTPACSGCKEMQEGIYYEQTADPNVSLILEAQYGCTWQFYGSVKIGEYRTYYHDPPINCSEGLQPVEDTAITFASVSFEDIDGVLTGIVEVAAGGSVVFLYEGPLSCNITTPLPNQTTSYCYTGGTASGGAYII